MHTRVERSVSDAAVIPAAAGKNTGLRNSVRAGVNYREHKGAAPEENRIAEKYGGRLRGDEKMYSSYVW